MICAEYLSAIDPYLDGELPVIDVVRMHRHLVGCERCRRVMNSEVALHALLSAEETQDQPGPSLRDQILQRVSAEDDGVSDVRRGRGRFAVLSAVLTGVALVAVLVLLMISGSTGRKPLAPFATELAAKHLLYSRGP